MTPGDEPEREVEHGEVGIGPLLPTDQDATEPVQPGVGALHHPAPGLGAGVPLGLPLLAPGPQVRGEAELRREGARLLVVVALVEAQALRGLGAGRSTGTASTVSRISLWSF